MIRKELVCGIIALFLGMNIIPIVGSLSIEKEQSIISKSCFDGIIIHGTMGENGWYVSDVVVTLDFPSYRIYFKIDDGSWQEYTVPIIVTGDGLHTVYCYYVDDEGNVSQTYSISFKIDATPPIVSLTVTPMNLLRTKWLVSVTAEDATSGVAVVELYVDGALVGTVTSAPYEFIYYGCGEFAEAIAYDCAGNYGSSGIIPMPLVSQQSKSQSLQGIQQTSPFLFFFSLLYLD